MMNVSNGIMTNQGGKKYKTVLKYEFLKFFYWCIARLISNFLIPINFLYLSLQQTSIIQK